ncbi:MAG TPA: DUF3995 domain-containing protein [Microvirga sp.]
MIPAVLSTILLALSSLHIYWGLGGRWPGSDEASFVEHVVGRTNAMKAPPPLACFGVAGRSVCSGPVGHLAHNWRISWVDGIGSDICLLGGSGCIPSARLGRLRSGILPVC